MKTMLSPKDLATAIGVSESSLKRWADEGKLPVMRTAGGHRRILLPDAVAFVRETKAAVVRPDILGLDDLGKLSVTDLLARQSSDQLLLDALQKGDSERARALITAAFLAGQSVASLCDGPIRSAMQKLGELWKHDPQGIFLEHRATDMMIEAVNQLRLLMRTPSHQAPVAIGGAAEMDPYILPSLMASAVLMDSGFLSVNLGPYTPVDSLITGSRHHHARLIWYSVSTIEDHDHTSHQLSTLAQFALDHSIALMIGGRAIFDLKLTLPPQVHLAQSMSELHAYAKGLLAQPPALAS